MPQTQDDQSLDDRIASMGAKLYSAERPPLVDYAQFDPTPPPARNLTQRQDAVTPPPAAAPQPPAGQTAPIDQMIEEARKRAQPPQVDTAQMDQRLAQIPQVAPQSTPGALPQAPAKREAPDNFKAFQNPMVLVALLGSLATRSPLTTAFQSAAAAMEGYNKGDTQAYERERQQFKDSLDEAMTRMKYENEKYKISMEQRNRAVDHVIADTFAQAAGNNDPYMKALAAKGDVDGMIKMQEARQKSYQQLVELKEKEKAREELQRYREQRTKIEEEKLKQLQHGQSTLSPDAIDFMAQQLNAGNTTVLTNLGRGQQGAANVVAVRERAAEMARNKDMSPQDVNANAAQFGGQRAGANALGRQLAQTEGAIEQATATSARVIEISEKIPRTEFKTLNQIMLAAERGTGGEDAVRLRVAVNTLVQNYARALSAGGTRTTDSARHEAQSLLEEGYSKGQMRAVVDQMLKEMDSEKQGAKKAIQNWGKIQEKDGAAPVKSTGTAPDVLKDARDAVARGAPKDAVKKRLQEMGVTPPDDL